MPDVDAPVPAPLPAAPLRIVLDTNAWLDWLVFDDPALAPLKHAQAAGAVTLVIDDACARELALVLARDLGKYTLTPEARAARLADGRRLAQRCDTPLGEDAARALPRCRDRDDQKFLELAAACGADVLVTQDKALLAVARRKTRPAPCRIVTPAALAATLADAAATRVTSGT